MPKHLDANSNRMKPKSSILGISCFYHDAAACLIQDGKIIATAEEERFTRKKHDMGFPKQAIEFCLQEGGINVEDLSYVGFYEKPVLKFERMMSQHFESWPFSFQTFNSSIPSWMKEKLKVESIIRKQLKYNGEILYVPHHMSHAASAFFVSKFKKAAILTIDGVGEWSTTTLGIGDDNKITLFKEIQFPHSLGLLYSTVTAYLGFSVNNSEYKVMGLSAFGKPTYYDKFMEIIKISDDGSYYLDMSYFDFHKKNRMPSKKFLKEFGPARKPDEKMTEYYMDIAASLQKVLEDAMFKILNYLYAETKTKNLCMAGGVALNSVANGKISKNTPFKNIFVQPAAGDSGGSLGIAAYINSLVNKNRPLFTTAYLGPQFNAVYVRNFLDKNNIVYTELEENIISKSCAKLIYQNKIVGWFQGRMEWGPRALGNRSILANAVNPNMRDILNTKVKHREHFRPFAPVILKEHTKRYFDIDKDEEKYMLFVYPIKQSMRQKLPSVTHVDGTGRLQTVSREQNKRYYDVIKEFMKLSGIPVVINTSFNIRGEPIVCKPEDAYRCMMGTEIDCTFIDKFLIFRKDNMKDSWDGESAAKD